MYRIISSSRTRSVVCCFLTTLVLLASAAVSAKAPKFPAPDDARVTLVSGGMKINGIHSEVRQFTTRDALEDVVDFYKDEWDYNTQDQPGYQISNVNRPWTLISRIEDGFLMTVQVQPTNDGGSWGFLALSRLPRRDSSPKLGGDFPSMRGSHTLNEVVSKDPGQSGRTMLLGNKHDIRSNVAFYRNRFRDEGWAFDMDQSLGGVMHVLALRKGRKRLNMVLSEIDKSGTRIVVNEVTHDVL